MANATFKKSLILLVFALVFSSTVFSQKKNQLKEFSNEFSTYLSELDGFMTAFIVYVAFFTEDSNPIAMYKQLIAIGKLSHVISLSVLINLLIFFMNIKTCRDEQARGILLATIFYGITIVIIKFF